MMKRKEWLNKCHDEDFVPGRRVLLLPVMMRRKKRTIPTFMARKKRTTASHNE
jgi:hypothetical protein